MKLQQNLSLLVALCALTLEVRFCQSFMPPSGRSPHHLIPSNRAASTSLHNMMLVLEEFDDDDEEEREGGNVGETENPNNRDRLIEQPQIHLILQALQGNGGGSIFGDKEASSSSLPLPTAEWKQVLNKTPAPPLTTMGRARLEKEIALLEQLAYGDDAAHKLATLWRNARGPGPARVLESAEGLMKLGHPIAWSQAETMLLQLIQEQDVHWVAPINSLATLKYMQGRMEESKELYELVLLQKPWHMGALVGVHNACKALDDYKGLVKWDRERMPSMEDEREYPSRRGKMATRAQWTQRMVEKAQLALQRAEEGLQGFFHDTYNNFGSEGSVLLESEEHSDAWQ